MSEFELYDKINRKTWIFQAIFIIILLSILSINRLVNVNNENKYYVLLFVSILLIKGILFLTCFIITKIRGKKK